MLLVSTPCGGIPVAKKYSKAMQKAEATKQNIYVSAMRLFSAQGYDNVSVDDIVREANSSKGTFYNYFRSKDELFLFYNQALEKRLEEFYHKLLATKHYSGKNALEKLYIMVMYTLRLLTESGREFTVISDMRQLRDENGLLHTEDVLCNSTARIYQPLIDLGRRDGSIDPELDGESICQLLYYYLKGIVYEWESSEEAAANVEEYAGVFDHFFLSIAGSSVAPQQALAEPAPETAAERIITTALLEG